MEGRDNDNNDMEEIRRMIQQLADRMARIETRNMDDDESFDGEQKDNPFHHRAPLGESDERGRGARPFNNGTARYFDVKVDNPFHHRAPLGESDERGRGARRFNNGTARYFDVNVDMPEFEGKIQPDKFIDWLNSVERIFDFKEVLDEKNVDFDKPPIFDNYQEEEEEITWSDHGESYKLSWIENENDVVANQQCLVAFSIGKKYKEIGDKLRRHTEFQEGDWVRRNLRNERFPHGKYDKLHDRGGCPYKVYHGGNEVVGLDSRTSPFQPGESDAGASNELSSRSKRKSEYELSNRPKRKSKAPSYLKGLLLKIILAFLILVYLFS